MILEADRLSGGLADGETRVFHGMADDPIPQAELQGSGAVVKIRTYVRQHVMNRMSVQPFLTIRGAGVQHVMCSATGAPALRAVTKAL